MENNEGRSNSRFWLGAFFIIGGGLLLASRMGFPVPEWVFSWEVLIIAIGLMIGIKHRFQSGGWLMMVAVGTFYLLDERIADATLHQYLLPILIIYLGIHFVLFPKKRGFKNRWKTKWDEKAQEAFSGAFNGNSDTFSSSATTTGGDDFIYVSSVFSGVKRTVFSKDFKGGEINCVFGGAEIDLLQADIQGTVTIKLEEVFGGVELRIPENWTVRTQIDGVFHGVDDKRRFQATVDANKVLILRGSAVFAGIEIKSW